MPKTNTYTYNGIDFILKRSDGAWSDNRYHATLIYAQNGIRLKKRPSARSEEELDRRLENETAPALFAEVVAKLSAQAAAAAEVMVSLPIFYAVWREDILARTKWSEATVRRKEPHLYEMFKHLPQNLPLSYLTLEDVTKAAAMAVWGRESIDAAEKKERDKYKALISTTSLILDRAAMAGFFSENFLRPYKEIIDTGTDDIAAMRKAFRNYHIEADVEALLYTYITGGISAEGLLFGVALMLFAGIKAEEACALQFGDIVEYTWMGQTIYVIRVSRIRASGKGEITDDMMVPSSYRCIPMHRQLEPLFQSCRKAAQGQLGKSKNLKLDNVYLVRSGKRLKGDTDPKVLKAFLTRLLKRAGVKGPPAIPLSEGDSVTLSANYTRLLRHNFENRMIDAGATADELNHLLGRAAISTDAKYYRDWASVYCMANLKNKMDRWHVRTDKDSPAEPVVCGDGLYIKDTGAVPVKLHAELSAVADAEYRIAIRSKHGLDVSAQVIQREADDGK